ncbi:hypothetical protein VNI00_001485 [Paramarasmius palmivorus]|uniref:DUF6697 domain-containing protein n=1 Tax=Paramarasmius palmivorus TaxID=297713 RepID=A0AAW0E346_9AGAR
MDETNRHDKSFSWSQVTHQRFLEAVETVSQLEVSTSDSNSKPAPTVQESDSEVTDKAENVAESPKERVRQDEKVAERVNEFLVAMNSRMDKLEEVVTSLKEQLRERDSRIDTVLSSIRHFLDHGPSQTTKTLKEEDSISEVTPYMARKTKSERSFDMQEERDARLKQDTEEHKVETDVVNFGSPARERKLPTSGSMEILEIDDSEDEASSSIKPNRSLGKSCSSAIENNANDEASPSTQNNSSESCQRTFSRQTLCDKIGGAIQSTLVRVTESRKPLAIERNIDVYVCPNIDQNPWCPDAPGKHGYMFVGLTVDHSTFVTKERRHIFLGERKTKNKSLDMTYLGLYECLRVDPLTVNEWESLSSDVQRAYSQLTKSRTKDQRPWESIKDDYSSGRIHVPCVRLTCVEYDHKLYEGLCSSRLEAIRNSETSSRTGTAKRPHRPSLKARSDLGDEDEDDHRETSQKRRKL